MADNKPKVGTKKLKAKEISTDAGAVDSELMQGEAAQQSEQYSNTESEQSKASTKQKPETGSRVDGSADEQAGAVNRPGTAKAGKRSPKAIKEADAKQDKEARKVSPKSDVQPKPTKKPTRSRAERAGKKYRQAAKLIETGKLYSLAEAVALAAKTSPTKFDATVELHVNLGVDPRQADQNVRDTVALPAGTGKNIRVAVVADVDDAAKAIKAGADSAGVDEILAKLEKETVDFDTLIATPAMMPQLGKFARLLGPRGLMPNPKSGTVTTDVAAAVKEAKAGRVEYRVDQAGIVHLGVGKVSFGADKLLQNAEAVMASIRAAKPASLKGTYIKSITVSTSMGPGIRVDNSRS